MITLRPISGTEALSKSKPISERHVTRPTEVLGAATVREVATPFEQALREAIASLKEQLTRVEGEADPLTRHLGYRAFNRDARARNLDPNALSDPEDQAYAQELLQTARGREAQSFAALDDTARVDLQVLLYLDERLHAREAAAHQRAAAAQVKSAERATVERLQQQAARHEAEVAQLPSTPRPAWLRVLGVVLATLSVAVLAALITHPTLWAALPVLRWTSGLVALSMVVVGGWLGMDPLQRRKWALEQLRQLSEWTSTAAQREAAANEALTHALKLFEEVDAECKREEAAALAVLKRRVGAERYVSLSGGVVAFDPG